MGELCLFHKFGCDLPACAHNNRARHVVSVVSFAIRVGIEGSARLQKIGRGALTALVPPRHVAQTYCAPKHIE